MGHILKGSLGQGRTINERDQGSDKKSQKSMEFKRIDLEDNPVAESSTNILAQLDTMKREVENLRRVESELRTKNKMISELERKVKQQA